MYQLLWPVERNGCDAWNAMRTDRSYRKALPHDVALTEPVSNAGRQFDPGVVQALVDIVDRPAGGVRPSPTAQLNVA